jgi:hypothetical protein
MQRPSLVAGPLDRTMIRACFVQCMRLIGCPCIDLEIVVMSGLAAGSLWLAPATMALVSLRVGGLPGSCRSPAHAGAAAASGARHPFLVASVTHSIRHSSPSIESAHSQSKIPRPITRARRPRSGTVDGQGCDGRLLISREAR